MVGALSIYFSFEWLFSFPSFYIVARIFIIFSCLLLFMILGIYVQVDYVRKFCYVFIIMQVFHQSDFFS